MGLIYGNMDHTTESRLTEDRYTSVLDGSGIELVECQSSLLYDSMDLSLGGGGGGHGVCWETPVPVAESTWSTI